MHIARFQFLDRRAPGFFGLHREESMNNTVALLRTEAGRNPHDKALTDLIGELVTRSEDFRTAGARHNVRLHYTGLKHLHHPVVGDLTLAESWPRVEVDGTRGPIRFSRTPGISVWQWAEPRIQVVDRDPGRPERFRILHIG